jgi:PD-(D/E)XK nuclease superfamily
VLLELKAISDLDSANYNQIQNCLEAFKIEVGLLLILAVQVFNLNV